MEVILVQLTDIHIKTDEDYKNLDSKSESIANAINKHIIDDENTLLVLCITGDIAFSGREEQYLSAAIFLSDIINKIKQRYINLYIQVLSIPGNHDCEFDREDRAVRDALLKDKKLDLENPSIIRMCTSVQENYFTFIKEWDEKIAPIMSVDDERILTINKLQYRDVTINFHCFNTAWCSSINEKPKEMRIFIPDMGDKLEDELVITLMHHDDAWLEWESAKVWKKYYKHYADIVLVGHDHESEIVLKDNYGAATNYFIKGNQLYSSEHPEQSGFNVLKIDLNSNIERFFSYEWNGSLYENTLDTKAREFKRNRYIKNGTELKPEILEYLNDTEIDLASKYKDPVNLSDIYVYPVLKGERISNKKEKRIYREKDEIINFIEQKKYVVISGEKEYGKTSLLKQLYKDFYSMKKYPVMVDATTLNTGDGDELNDRIADSYIQQYLNLDKETILQMDPERRVCIIDNYEEIKISDKVIKSIFCYLTSKFGIVVITSNIQNELVNFLKNVETKDYLDKKFTRLYIQDIKNYMRRKLVDKWLLLADDGQDVDSQAFDVLRRNKLAQVKSVMKTGFFNKTPIEFLLVLSYLDNYDKMNTDYSRYSYIYECLILDKINEIANGDTNEATMYKTILEQLAYKIFDESKEHDVEESFVLGVDYRGSKGSGIEVLKKLEEHKILEKKGIKYRFKYRYMYYYFTGSYIQNQLHPTEKSIKVKEIFSDLSKELNFNLALFLAYDMNVQYEILPQIKDVCKSLLVEYKDFNYSKQRELLDKLEYNINQKVDKIFNIPKNADIPRLQIAKALKQDELESELDNVSDKEKDQYSDDELEKISIEFTKTIRTIEFLGDILKNYSSSIKRIPRIEIIELMYEASMKLMGALYYSLEGMADTIIEIVDEKAKEDDEEIAAKSQFKQKIQEFLSQFWSAFVSVNVSNLGYSLQSDRIVDEVLDVKSRKQCTFFRLVCIDYLIRTQNGHLPVKEIEECLRGKNKIDIFSKNILSNNVASFLKNYQFNIGEKKAVCSLLEFNIKDILLDEQKNKAFLEDE